MNNKIKAGECYAVCSLVEKGLFKRERVIIIGTSKKEYSPFVVVDDVKLSVEKAKKVEEEYKGEVERKEELLVDEECLGLSLDGFVVARFYIEEIKNGLAHGVVYNCENGWPSGKRIIPLDSIVRIEEVKKYDGRTQKNL